MRIEVAIQANRENKDKGDLLEELAERLLDSQNYEVTTQMRRIGSELDLLCRHRVNRKTIYVECKAQRNTVSSKILKNLLGTVTLEGYQEGWLISTAPFGKDAKGVQWDWEEKPPEESQKLSFYTPDRIIQALEKAKILVSPPFQEVKKLLNDDQLGEWVVLITEFGYFWSVTALIGGVPEGVLVFSARTGQLIEDPDLLAKLNKTDASISGLNFRFIDQLRNKDIFGVTENEKRVVEVQQGLSWDDYRPARPEDFVGREDAQGKVFQLFKAVREGANPTRVFAITGDSGMGKSSLIAKLRDRSRNSHNKKKFFVMAVDVRAAESANYIMWSLLSCLRAASANGFGSVKGDPIKISNVSDPLNSSSIKNFFNQLRAKKQVVCLIFDQFEELYTKPELFEVFEAAKSLFLSTVSIKENFVLGFAWKSDSTFQQSHPAYYFWHQLADYRLPVDLKRFKHSEASSAITRLEKQIGEKLQKNLRRQIIENSQGFPWLLKKFSIHICEQMKSQKRQTEIFSAILDVESLFKEDLLLSPKEKSCVQYIAENSPVDAYEILAKFGSTLDGLQNRRIAIRSGDRVILYWDIFKEYVLTGKVPSIPFSYLPSSPSLGTLLAVASKLSQKKPESFTDLGKRVNIAPKTVGNVLRDLSMFGLATAKQSMATLNSGIENSTPEQILGKIRSVLIQHALTISLFKEKEGERISAEELIEKLQETNPAAQHQSRTWRIYGDRMALWLCACGLIKAEEGKYLIQDSGEVNPKAGKASFKHRSINVFIGDTTPIKAFLALKWLAENGRATYGAILESGHKKGFECLRGLNLIIRDSGEYFLMPDIDLRNLKIALHKAAADSTSVKETVALLLDHPQCNGIEVGDHIGTVFERNWSDSSKMRTGNALKLWANWVLQCKSLGRIPDFEDNRTEKKQIQLSLF